MKTSKGKRALILFIISLVVIVLIFVSALIRTNVYNTTNHEVVFAGEKLFSTENKSDGVTVSAVARGSTWGKIFDFNNEGITENNYQAYTYDFTVSNNTKDEVKKFSFKLTFSHEAFLAQAWNGSLEIHQHVGGGERVATIPDLRDYNPDDYSLLDIVKVDGEPFIVMQEGDYLVYIPSVTANALEMPIEPNEGTTPGIIMYVAIGESIEESSLELNYTFNRLLRTDVLFWISVVGIIIWVIALIIFGITSAQIKKYNVRHERDNKIINESIETFTGFIDAKDPYTNGHSKRVATYTKMIAKEMGYDGEQLDNIYYIALLHDCGKMGVPDSILGKPGKLTEEEFEIIKSHTVRGGEILSSFKSLKNAGEGALYHHERYDGKGYPKGLAGEEIPLIARMICVADSFDAMNSNRVYRKKLTGEYIINELEINKGAQFDPKIADIMLKLIKNGKVSVDD